MKIDIIYMSVKSLS